MTNSAVSAGFGAGSGFGVSSNVTPLQTVGMRRPGAILSADPGRWHYGGPIDARRLRAQYDQFVKLVASSGATIVWLDDTPDDLADSIFAYDPSFMLPSGAVLLRPGKPLRRGEVDLHRRLYEQLGVPIIGAIDPPGTVEGGDIFWLDDRTLAVGRGFRTNDEGIEQFKRFAVEAGCDVMVFDLPVGGGPDACLHLLSLLSPIDTDLVVAYLPLLPVPLFDALRDRGVGVVEVPEHEFVGSGGLNLNVLALSPRRLLAIDGFDETVHRLRQAECEVTTFRADALCLPCEGGPTCLTLPIWRQ